MQRPSCDAACQSASGARSKLDGNQLVTDKAEPRAIVGRKATPACRTAIQHAGVLSYHIETLTPFAPPKTLRCAGTSTFPHPPRPFSFKRQVALEPTPPRVLTGAPSLRTVPMPRA
jgi:hypothetical protein